MDCRFYREKYPKVNDLVLVKTEKIEEMGAYCSLLEYGEIEGMILLSELSRKRIKSIQKIVKVGRNEVCIVLKVDQEKGYVDLSKRRVTIDQTRPVEERYVKSKTVHSIMKSVAEKSGTGIEELYSSFCWDLYDKYEHALDAFKLAVTDPETIFGEFGLGESVYDELTAQITKRLTLRPVKIRVDLNISCYTDSGIDTIKQVLLKAMADSEFDIKIKLIAAPTYFITMTCLDRESGINYMTRLVQDIKQDLNSKGSELTIAEDVRVVSSNDDARLEKIMKILELETLQVSGDSDSEAESD